MLRQIRINPGDVNFVVTANTTNNVGELKKIVYEAATKVSLFSPLFPWKLLQFTKTSILFIVKYLIFFAMNVPV